MALSAPEATLIGAAIAAVSGLGGALLTSQLQGRRAKREREVARRQAREDAKATELERGAENRRVVREQYLALTGRLAAALEAAAFRREASVDRVQDAYEAVQACGRGQVDTAFGTQSAVRWCERRIRSVLDGGRKRALETLAQEDTAIEPARDELLVIVGLLADKALENIFKPEADAAIAQPGKILTEPVTSPEERQWLRDQVIQYGGHPVED